MKYLVSIVLGLSSFYLVADDSEDREKKLQEARVQILGFIATGRFAGDCSTYYLQKDFQKKHKVVGGNIFIQDFWAYKAKDNNMTISEYTKFCDDAIDTYVDYMKKLKPTK